MIKKLRFTLFFVIILSLILIGISLFSYFNSTTESSIQWQAVCWTAYLIVFVLFIRRSILIYGYFDLRMAPIYSIALLIIPRISVLFFEMLQKGVSVHPVLNHRLVLTPSSFSVGLGLMISGILLYIIGSFGICYFKPDRNSGMNKNAQKYPERIQQSMLSPKILIFLSFFCLVVYLLIVLYFLEGKFSNLTLSVVDPVFKREVTSKITQSFFALPFSLSVMFSIAAIFFARKNSKRRIQIITLFLAIIQSVVILPLGNRQAVLFPLLLWIIVTGIKRRKIAFWKVSAILVCILLFVVIFASIRYGTFPPDLNSFSPTNLVNSFTSELIMFDTFALIYPSLHSGSLEYRLGGNVEDIRYFLPSFLLKGPKPDPADFQLSLKLGIADYEPFGTPPTIFGGLLWNFGIWGLVFGSFIFGIIVYKLNNYLRHKMILRRNSAESNLVFGVVFIFLMDAVRVGVFMREILTLMVHVTSLVAVIMFIKLSMFKADK